MRTDGPSGRRRVVVDLAPEILLTDRDSAVGRNAGGMRAGKRTGIISFRRIPSTVTERRESLGVIDNQSHHSLQRRFEV